MWDSSEEFDRRSAWIDLLLLANHDEKQVIFNNNAVTVKRGQRITSIRELAKRWHWGKDKTLRYLRLLEALQMIHRDSDSNRTLITIVNYSFYQDIRDTKRDSDKDSNKDSNKDSDKPQTTMRNNEKQYKQIYIGFCDEELDAVLKDFVEMRKKIKKPMTNRAIEMLIKKVKELSPALPFSDEEYNKATAKAIMEQSIERSWSSVYPLKESEKSGNRSDKEPAIGYKDPATDKVYIGDGKWDYDNSVWE